MCVTADKTNYKSVINTRTKFDSVIDTIVLINESFFIFWEWLREYVFEIAKGALLFRELICITKKGYNSY